MEKIIQSHLNRTKSLYEGDVEQGNKFILRLSKFPSVCLAFMNFKQEIIEKFDPVIALYIIGKLEFIHANAGKPSGSPEQINDCDIHSPIKKYQTTS